MKIKKNTVLVRVKRDYLLYTMLVPGILLLAVFSYAPMFGIVIGFKDMNPRFGIWGKSVG